MSFADDIEAVADHAGRRLRQIARVREQETAAAAMRWRESSPRSDRARSAESEPAESGPAPLHTARPNTGQADSANVDEEQRQRDREQGIYRRRY